jgi:CheY-like chemotaxis protein
MRHRNRLAVAVTAITPVASKAVKMNAPLAGVTILVVDEQPDVTSALQILLEGQGARVTACNDPALCFELLHGLQPQVLIVTLHSPERSGLDLIKAVRALPMRAGGATPAIWLTSAPERERAVEAGFQVGLKFPSTRELVALIRTLAGPS